MTDPKKPEDEAPNSEHIDEIDESTASDAADTESESAEAESDAKETAEHDADAGSDAQDTADDDTDADAESAEATDTAEASDADSSDEGQDADDADTLTEDEKLEIAEAALRDAERGYTSDEPVTPPPSMDESATVAAAAAGGAAAATASGASSTPASTITTEREIIVERKSGGFVPGFVGGAIAAVGAAFAAPYVLPENMRPVMTLAPVEASLEAQSSEISGLVDATAGVAENVEGLTGRVASVEETASQAVTPDALSALEARLGEIQSELMGQNEELGVRIDDLATNLDLLSMDFANFERSPLEDSTDPAVIAALASYARDVQSLREEVEAQTAENARVIEEAAAATAEARAAAEAEQEAAAERAAVAARQQAMVDIKSALDSGEPFAEALAAFGDDAPDALSSVASQGVATLASLQASYAAPARDALDAARRANVGEEPAERGLTFLQTQLGMRSLAPRDGDSADAILSRAEAATQSGDLATAISELEALPEAAAAPLTDWIARASSRADAIAAADALAQSTATN